jgi:FtsP/CotA-like multicopper oxidase with cupredoxin domain
MHLHGHNFYILHEGPGAWDGTIVRPSNPHRRDVHLVRGNGHLVIQFDGAPGMLSPSSPPPQPVHTYRQFR